MDWKYLLYIGLAALAVYGICLYAERRRPRQDEELAWKTMELAKTLAELCQSEVSMPPSAKAHIFMDREQGTFRWSWNGYCLERESEICTVEAAGILRLQKFKANTDMLLGMASDILRAYAQKQAQDRRSR